MSRTTVEAALAQLIEALYGDDKTELRNGLAFRSELAKVESAEEAYDLFIGDLDSFKEVNSTHGYDGGDAAIARAGQVLQTALDPLIRDHRVVVFRQSGDEFAVVAPATQRERVTKAITAAFASITVSFNKTNFEIRGSFGRADCAPEISVEEWKTRAELALLHAKRSDAIVVEWSPALERPTDKLRRRCSSCKSSFVVQPTDPKVTEVDLFCPQCGRGPGRTAERPSSMKALPRSAGTRRLARERTPKTG